MSTSNGIPSLRDIRLLLGKNQREMADQLGVSLRAIQSYEQEWRSIPPHLHRIALLLLKLHLMASGAVKKPRTCWQIKQCGPQKRASCPAGNSFSGHCCWLVAGAHCQQYQASDTAEELVCCSQCEVMHDWLRQSTEEVPSGN